MIKDIEKFILWFYPIGAILIIAIYLLRLISYLFFFYRLTKDDVKLDFILLLRDLSPKHYYKTLKKM